MEILLDNPLGTMYGPYFLVFYGFVIFFTLVILGITKTRVDQTDKLALPPIPSTIDPYEIAYLRGGINEMARSVAFSLMQKGFLEIEDQGSGKYLNRVKDKTDSARLNSIEQISLDWIKTRQEIEKIFQPNGLVDQLKQYGEVYEIRLEQQQMLIGDKIKARMSRLKWIAISLIGGLGIYKIFVAVLMGHFNFVGIILFGAAGLTIAHFVSKLPRMTKLGKRYLERLQLAFNSLKYEAQKGYLPSNEPRVVQQATFAGVDPLLLSVGVFGGVILAGTVFDDYNQTFQKAQHQAAASGGSSCGSGCGSCSSSDGGSSCSSGSSCGSGCGGCGGGCGG